MCWIFVLAIDKAGTSVKLIFSVVITQSPLLNNFQLK